MAAGLPGIYTGVRIMDGGGTANPATFDLLEEENKTIQETPKETRVDDGQSIQNGFDNEFMFRCIDLDILDDTRVQYGATIPTTLAKLEFTGAAGASTKTIDNVRLSGRKVFEGERDTAEIKATKVSANSIITLSS